MMGITATPGCDRSAAGEIRPVNPGPGNKTWYTGLALNANQATGYTTFFENGTFAQSGVVVWRPVNLFDTHEITIPADSELLMGAWEDESDNSALNFTIQGQAQPQIKALDSLSHLFDTAGDFTVTVFHVKSNTTQSLTVHVEGADLPSGIALCENNFRVVPLPDVKSHLVLDCDNEFGIDPLQPAAGGGSKVRLEGSFPGTYRTAVRMNPNGPNQGTTVYDYAGKVIQQIRPNLDLDGNPEITTITHNSATHTTNTLNPDGGTIVSTDYADGQFKSTTGTAVPDSSQTITVGSDLDGIIGAVMKTTTTRPSNTAAGDLVSTTYTAIGGRTLLTKLNGTTTATYGYDNLSRPILVTDGDGVKQHTAYNAKGEAYRRATSRDGNNTIDPGTDTVSETLTDVTPIDGFGPAIRRISKVWTGANTSVITSTTLQSPDGTKSSTTTLGVANPSTSLSATHLDRVDGAWTDTQTAPDGTKQTTTYSNWLATTQASYSSLPSSSLLSSVSITHDALRRPETQTDSRTGLVTTIYSPSHGQVTSINDHGRETSFKYDNMGRRVETTLPDNTKTHTVYSDSGQPLISWGSQTYPTYNTYDEQDRRLTLRTKPTLTPAGVPTDAGGSLTTWFYYPNGQLQQKQDDAGKGATYTYTNGGRLHTRTWARGVLTTYGYTHGLMTSTDYSDTTPDAATTYDALGRRKSVTNTLATSVFDYAADLGPDKETITYTLPGQSPFTRVLDRRDRSFGRDTGWELKNGPTLENEATYQYSATTGRLETVANSADVFTYGYLTHSSLLATVTKAASGENPALVATRAYEPTRDTLASIENNAGVIIRSKYDYATVNGGVNSLGQRMGVQTTFNLGAGHLAIPGDTSWGYDNLGQLTSANHDTVDTIDRGYQYDTIGNRLFSEKGAPQIPATPGLNTTGYTADALNQYDAITPYDASGVAGTPVAPVFDFDGNMTTGPLSGTAGSAANHLDWDAENRLVQVRAADDTAVITSTLYDAQSRRIATTTGGITTLYLYDGFNCIAEYTQSVPAVSAVLSKTRLWGLDLSGTLQGAGGVGGLLAEKQGANTLYPTYDGNGNVSEYLEADGDVAAHFEYDPFGNIIKESYAPGYDATSFTYKFSTKPLDLATGLYYYLYRYYDPTTGRWPSRDPIEEQGGINLYGFVRNDGVNKWDVLGLDVVGEEIHRDYFSRVAQTFFSYTVIWIQFPDNNITYTYSSSDDYIPKLSIVRSGMNSFYESWCREKHSGNGGVETISIDGTREWHLTMAPAGKDMKLSRFWLGSSGKGTKAISGSFDCCVKDGLIVGSIDNIHVNWIWKDTIDARWDSSWGFGGQSDFSWAENLVVLLEHTVWWRVPFKVNVDFTDHREGNE